MTAKYWQAGEVLDYTPSDNAVANGEVVSLGTRIGVAGADIAKGATGPLYVEGVFYMDKASGAVTMGAAMYYDVANKKITTVASTGEGSAKVDNIPGGYGSSYSQAVGQQQYDAYLQKLNGVVPELYQLAYSRYQDEGDELKDQYNMYMAKDAQDYDRAQINYAQLQSQMNSAADQVKAILEVGGSPSADLVLRSGLSDEYVQTLKNYYAQLAAQAAAQSASGRSSGGRSSKKSSSSTFSETGVDDATYRGLRDTLYYGKQANGTTWAQNQLVEMISEGKISKKQADTLAAYVGLKM